MRICRCAQTLVFVALAAAPALSVADEEALLRGKAFNRLQLLILRRFLPCGVGENQAAKISGIFSQRQLAVDLDVINDRVAGVLV